MTDNLDQVSEDQNRVASMRRYYGEKIAKYNDEEVIAAWRRFVYSTYSRTFLHCIRYPNDK